MRISVALCYPLPPIAFILRMGLPVKLSDDLVNQARIEAEIAHRSLTAQVEYWAHLGRKAERLLGQAELRELSLVDPDGKARGVSALREALTVALGSKGKGSAKAKIFGSGVPVYEAAPDHPGHIVRVTSDGKRTLGRIVNREFVATE
jgi:hypothetical protein